MNDFYIIDPNLSLEENIKLRNEFYTEEKINSYDDNTKKVVKENIMNDKIFESLYKMKVYGGIKFVSTTQAQHDVFVNS